MEDCLFCKMVKGDIPSVKVYEDESFLVVQDINQNTDGHSLIIPKEHSKNILEMNAELGCQFFKIIDKVGNAMINGLKADGFNLIFNTNSVAGQAIFHTHGHIIPRYKDDGFKHWPAHPVSEEKQLIFAGKIIKELQETEF